jgi:predicted Zn-dependent protease
MRWLNCALRWRRRGADGTFRRCRVAAGVPQLATIVAVPESAAQGLPAAPSPGAVLTVRHVAEESCRLTVRRSIVQPIEQQLDAGAMVTVWRRHGIGYCATADTGAAGLRRAAEVADHWARVTERHGVFEGVDLHEVLAWTSASGRDAVSEARAMPVRDSEPMPPRATLVGLLRDESDAMQVDPRIVDRVARLVLTERRQRLWVDGRLQGEHDSRFVEPNLEATAAEGPLSQSRSLGGQYNGFCQQGGFDVIRRSGLPGSGRRIAEEALQLLVAPECPSGTLDLLLMPDQMMLQIHESIGHPLELDRILGDERNFAGTSFVTPDMFGHYQYGSRLLNVTFDPGVEHELASYPADDDGEAASRTWLIRDGLLLRPIGGALSLARAAAAGYALQGNASARSVGWHRPTIDRMANLNIEAGDASLERMVSSIRRGVLMRTNVSWSIDDARNKFQFGCEWGQLIEDGRLTTVVRNPCYRGVSATFWRSLAMVGDASTRQVLGTPFCGKGEPGQVIRVGHASPACLFRDVEVFGGEA